MAYILTGTNQWGFCMVHHSSLIKTEDTGREPIIFNFTAPTGQRRRVRIDHGDGTLTCRWDEPGAIPRVFPDQQRLYQGMTQMVLQWFAWCSQYRPDRRRFRR